MKLRNTFFVAVTSFWLVMSGLLIQKEFFELAPIQAPYEILPLHSTPLREDYFGTYLDGQLIGFVQSALEANTDWKESKTGESSKGYEAASPFELRHVTYLSFRLLGRENEMLVKGRADLNEQLHLDEFQLKITSDEYRSEIIGKKIDSNVEVIIEDKDSPPMKRVLPVSGPLIHSEALLYLWTPKNLKIGKRGRIRVWNPLLLQTEDIRFHVAKKEVLRHDNRDLETYVVFFEHPNQIRTRNWISPEGHVIRMETPMGLIVQNEPGWKILSTLREGRASLPDLPNLYSITADQNLENLADLRFLKLIVSNARGKEQLFEISKMDFNQIRDVPLNSPKDAAIYAYLEPDAFIQSEDPVIQAKAKEILERETMTLQAALKLMRWVHQTMIPAPTASLPSARQVLEVKKGDCNEYTALFTALARAVGIPTKMVAGLVYQNGRFFYHAWPTIYVGQWIPLDPTFNQAPTDVSHIPLVEGSLQEQIQLAALLGNLEIKILDKR